MKKNIISVRSTLRKKNRFSKNDNKVLSAKDNMLRSESTGRLKVALILIPILMVLIILIALFFAIREFSKSTGLHSPANLQNSSNYTPAAVTSVDTDINKKLLMVVSPSNPIDDSYKPNLVSYQNIKIDKEALSALTSLMNAAKNAKLSLNIVSGYISADEQNELYNNEVQRLIARKGYSQARAETDAEKNAPKGGNADAQTGLSVKFANSYSKTFENSDEYEWLIKNAMKYGFVLRYPENKTDETEMNFNSSLFRYVGIENATKMRTLNMCLDEYSSYLSARNY